jgi:hypothetical protein
MILVGLAEESPECVGFPRGTNPASISFIKLGPAFDFPDVHERQPVYRDAV